MAVIVTQAQMGRVRVQLNSVADYHMRKEKACNQSLGCLMCKAFFDTRESQKHPITNDTTIGMTERINHMRDNKEWMEGGNEKKLLMTCCHLGTIKMKT
eukprot:15856064-Heterocapsa_arctica.AAC.1